LNPVNTRHGALTRRALDSGLVPSMGSIGDCYDNGQMESFWARMQGELLNGKEWNTRLELANAIFEYLEIFHNRQRRHSALACSAQSSTSATTPTTLPAIKQADRAKHGAHDSLQQSQGGSKR
jgi:putative transposase